ncbi:MAG TPA: sigma-70 family RNA polymerase sigma factor [Actinotalea caeni]|uniref:RNA polymerase sigma factor n=1 Tax=Actinotalea caeni TaxID=1348467 RepID=UPI002B4B9289|nr:sigma-70 family RNA polymerase sigma factor [Actinotalea caeni]HLV54720.1 sigma-70 family RNA polymerase sigma factor [Actinotalea caeni]
MTAWEETLSVLVREHGQRLHRTAYLLCGDRHTAEDLVQEAFVRVLGRRRGAAQVTRGMEPYEVEAYLRRSILNLYLDSYRRRRRWAGIRHLAAGRDRVESAAARTEARVDATRALAQLPPQVRACMVLHYYEDMSVAQVAAELELAEGTVKRYLSDGRAILAVSLAEPADADSSRGGAR